MSYVELEPIRGDFEKNEKKEIGDFLFSEKEENGGDTELTKTNSNFDTKPLKENNIAVLSYKDANSKIEQPIEKEQEKAQEKAQGCGNVNGIRESDNPSVVSENDAEMVEEQKPSKPLFNTDEEIAMEVEKQIRLRDEAYAERESEDGLNNETQNASDTQTDTQLTPELKTESEPGSDILSEQLCCCLCQHFSYGVCYADFVKGSKEGKIREVKGNNPACDKFIEKALPN